MTRRSVFRSWGFLIAAAVIATAAIYYGAIPWALDRLIAAILWLFGYRW